VLECVREVCESNNHSSAFACETIYIGGCFKTGALCTTLTRVRWYDG